MLAKHDISLTFVHLCQDGVPHHTIYVIWHFGRTVGPRDRPVRGAPKGPALHLGQRVGASCRNVFIKVKVAIKSFIVRVLSCGSTDKRKKENYII